MPKQQNIQREKGLLLAVKPVMNTNKPLSYRLLFWIARAKPPGLRRYRRSGFQGRITYSGSETKTQEKSNKVNTLDSSECTR